MKVSRLASRTAIAIVLAGLYFLAGKLGLSLASVHPSASAVWPPTGIALAALLRLGWWPWPAVFVGAFLVNITTAGTFVTSLGIASGNTLEALLGAYLIRRLAGGMSAFDRPGTVFIFSLVALACSAVSATMGVVTLASSGLASWSSFARIWLTWWLGDAAGALVFCPFLVLMSQDRGITFNPRRVLEGVALVVATLVSGAVVFAGALFADRNYPIAFMCVPSLIWAALRFGRRVSAGATVLLSVLAIGGTLRGFGPFARPDVGESLLLLQSYLAVLAVMALAVAASVALRRGAERGIRRLNNELEQRIAERTVQLRGANEELRSEIQSRTRADLELKKSEARLLEAQRIANIGSWEWDIPSDALWWSDELYRIYGYARGEVDLGYRHFLDAVHSEDRERVDRIVRTAFQDGRPFQFEHRIVRRDDGQVRTLYAEGRVVPDEQGRPARMLGIGQDITERKLAEEQRTHLLSEQIARREAEEANRRKDHFLATLSHELRTPLSAIVGWCHLWREGGLDEATTRRATESIERNARIQAQLISDILDVSRLDTGKLEITRQVVALADVLDAALETVRPQALERRITVDVHLDRLVGRIVGDPLRLQQVAWNLLTNAVKFAAEGGRVELSLRRNGERAEVEVRDDGPGVDPAFLPYIFDAFRQDDSSTTRRHGGLGLGLAIARHIVELHGGVISAANRADRSGAVFTVSLPITMKVEMPARDGPTTRDEPAPRLDELRLLVVDDEADAREIVSLALGQFGAQVVACHSAAEGMSALRQRPFDVLISDIAMPGEDGLDFIGRVRAEPSVARIPAIALTAYAGAEDVQRALAAGFHVHLAKPVDVVDLARIVMRLARGDTPVGRAPVSPGGTGAMEPR